MQVLYIRVLSSSNDVDRGCGADPPDACVAFSLYLCLCPSRGAPPGVHASSHSPCTPPARLPTPLRFTHTGLRVFLPLSVPAALHAPRRLTFFFFFCSLFPYCTQQTVFLFLFLFLVIFVLSFRIAPRTRRPRYVFFLCLVLSCLLFFFCPDAAARHCRVYPTNYIFLSPVFSRAPPLPSRPRAALSCTQKTVFLTLF